MDNGVTTFANWVTVTAKSLGYRTDAQLAAAIKVQQSTVTRWRQGKQPQIRHLVEIARLFKMPIDSLLVLSGHVPEDLIGDTRPAGAPMTESVRRIRDAPLTDMQKDALQAYWSHRLDEERSRLNDLIEGIIESEDRSRQDVGSWTARVLVLAGDTDRVAHTYQLLRKLFAIDAAPRKRRRRVSQRDSAAEQSLWDDDDIDTPEKP
jgi:transcriptional regulator with XRE-family HTH domain